jgi:hypothetical protein
MPVSRFYPFLILALVTVIAFLGFFIFEGSSASPAVVLSLPEQETPPSSSPVRVSEAVTEMPSVSVNPAEPVAGAAAGTSTEPRAPEGQAPASVNAAGPETRKTYIPSYSYDPFIPVKWRALPENAPLKRLVQQVALPRSAAFQAPSDSAQAEQAVRSATMQIPAVFADQASQTALNDTGKQVTANIQDQFIEKVSELPGKPTDAAYQRAWNRARLEADSQFAAMFGTAALEARRSALLQNPESN